jgi:hypothetical protein
VDFKSFSALKTDYITFTENSITAYTIKSYVHGYRLKDDLIHALRHHFSQQPFVVPAQMIRTYSFPQAIDRYNLDTQLNIPLIHATEAILLFPRNNNDVTCFLNPNYQDVQLRILDIAYPDYPLDTAKHSTLRQQLQVCNLDFGLKCKDSFESSMIMIPSGEKGERFYVSDDVTEYALTFPIEIPNTDAFNGSGVTSTNKANSLVTLTGKTKNYEKDIYYNIDGLFADEAKLPTDKIATATAAPILCLVSYSFFLFVLKNGGVP